MGAAVPLVVPLTEAAAIGEKRVGGKAAKLSELSASGYRVPDGFCITTRAYERFVEEGGLKKTIDMETQRKSMSSMRWEEIWDAALRIRTAFMRTAIPVDVTQAIVTALHCLKGQSMAVRSSAVGEDSPERSFAGLHESVVGVRGEGDLLDSVRLVWASLWSDAALLYRRELALDSTDSAMAVVVQRLFVSDRSGVGFGRDPRDPSADRQVLEVVPGLCQDLVDGAVDPDRWLLRRSTGEVIEWHAGVRGGLPEDPLLDSEDVGLIHRTLNALELAFGWPPDMEWTGRGAEFTVLQARPVTSKIASDDGDQREWYLSLRPGRRKLEVLCRRVVEELIPELEADGQRLTDEQVEDLSDEALAKALDERDAIFSRWKQTYWDEFIPFAHGVRQLGTYYNDAVKPDDPYEFVNILRHQPMIASERNAAFDALARYLRQHSALHELLRNVFTDDPTRSTEQWPTIRESAACVGGGPEFLAELERVCERYMDAVYDGERLDTRPDLVLHTVLELAIGGAAESIDLSTPRIATPEACEQRLFEALAPARHEEARSVLSIARLSWRLRDDDNVLLGRVEKQLLRAASAAAERLERSGRIEAGVRITAESAAVLSAALLGADDAPVVLLEPKANAGQPLVAHEGEKPRQIVGQPAARGLATARARVVRSAAALKRFLAGEVLICDAIQPNMSHIVPLAAAIVERRGGMLIHGAIIARELGIPCVNGVNEVILTIDDGEVVTVDGYLGIVTIGPPEFDLETAHLYGGAQRG